MTITNIPNSIPLNCIDRVYLIPETESLDGAFFPSSITRTLFFKDDIEKSAVIDVLLRLNTHFPQLRLAYRLNIEALRWEKVPDNALRHYFESLVTIVDAEVDIDELLGQFASVNTSPTGTPINFFIRGSQLSIKMFHVFGDDGFLSKLLRFFLFALLREEEFEELPELSNNFWMPIYRVIWADINQAAKVLSQFLWTTIQKVFRYRNEVSQNQDDNLLEAYDPIVSGSEMGVVRSTISPQALNVLAELRGRISGEQKISLNTILQVEIARRLQKKGYVGNTVCYSIPVDLHRYLDNREAYYPGNLSTQLRITINETDVVAICNLLQDKVSLAIKRYEPLVGLPFEWVMHMLPRKLYDNLHRSWMLNTTINQSRFFVLTNLGSFDNYYSEFSDVIEPDMYLTVPIMDTAMVVSFNTLQGQGNLCATFNPDILNRDDVMDILDFDGMPLTIEEGIL